MLLENKVRSFGFATQEGADLFVARLDRKAYARAERGDLKIGDFRVQREGDEISVLVFPMTAKDLLPLEQGATYDRAKAGEPKRMGGQPPKEVEPAEAAAPKAAKQPGKKRAPKARKTKRALVETAPQVREENSNGTGSPSPLAALISDYESRRDRLQLVIDNLRAAERVMAESA